MTPTDCHEFERAYPLGARTCDTCGDWLPDSYWTVDECYERIVQGEDDELDTIASRTYELRKFCSVACTDDATHGVLAFLDAHHLKFEGDGPGMEPVTPCAGCGVPVLRLVEHSVLSLLEIEPDHHVVDEQHLAVLCPCCGGFYDDDGGDDDPDDGLPLIEPPVLLAA